LPVELALEDPPGGVDACLVSRGEGLGSSEFGLVDAEGSCGGQDGAVAVELEVADFGVGHPAERLEGDVTGMT